MRDPAIAIMARAAGARDEIKTRLAGALPASGDRRALSQAFLRDIVSICRRIERTVLRVAFTPGDLPDLASIGVAHDEVRRQRGTDLGDRERELFEDLFADGHGRVLVIGSDVPTLPASTLERALAILESTDPPVVLGPADDGGYYLIGLAAGGDVPDLFSGIRWSTPFALADTLEAAARAGRRVSLVDRWHDVDEPSGLEGLIEELENPEIRARAPATAAALQTLGLRTRPRRT
jgi:rSAM/selenodomain-associated transferase 1